MTLKNIFIFLFATTLFYSCNTELIEIPEQQQQEEEEEENEETTDDSVLIKQIIYNMGTDDEYIDTFNYDGNKLINIDYGDDSRGVFTYDSNDNLIKDEFIYEGELAASVTLEYNSENEITEYVETFFEASGLDDRSYKHIFTHNADGSITSEVYISHDGSDFELSWTDTILFEGNNISSVKDDNDPPTEYIYTYDDKNGIYKNIHAIEILNLLSENEFGPYIFGNANNITSSMEKYDDNGVEELYEYTYGENGYPKNAILKEAIDGVIDEDFTETIDYIYE